MTIYYNMARYLAFALETGNYLFLSVSEYLAEFTDLFVYSINFRYLQSINREVII